MDDFDEPFQGIGGIGGRGVAGEVHPRFGEDGVAPFVGKGADDLYLLEDAQLQGKVLKELGQQAGQPRHTGRGFQRDPHQRLAEALESVAQLARDPVQVPFTDIYHRTHGRGGAKGQGIAAQEGEGDVFSGMD